MASCKEPILKSVTTPVISACHPFKPIQNLLPNASSFDAKPSSFTNVSLTTDLGNRKPSGIDSDTALVSAIVKNLPAFKCNPYTSQNLSSVIIVVTDFRFGSSRPIRLILVPQCVFSPPLGGLVENDQSFTPGMVFNSAANNSFFVLLFSSGISIITILSLSKPKFL